MGLYYYRARYLDPRLGRFISEDPIGLAGGMNGYVYALNRPFEEIDPSGLKPPDYNPDFWNERRYVRQNNCYNYAWNKRVGFGPLHPGGSIPPGMVTCPGTSARAKLDGFMEPDAKGCCKSDYHRVKLYVGDDIKEPYRIFGSSGQDYHWAREDSNGRWSQKHGLLYVQEQTDDPDGEALQWGYNHNCGALCAPDQ